MAEEAQKQESPDIAPKGAIAETGLSSDDSMKAVQEQGKTAVEIAQMSLKEIKQMEKQELRDMFLSGTSVSGLYHVDFMGNKKAEAKVGLKDFFGEESPLLIIQKNPDEDAFYAERGKDGFYYEPGTDKKVSIFTGYEVRVLGNGEDLIGFKEEADQDRMANLKKAKRNEAIAHLRKDKAGEKQVVAKEKTIDPQQKLLAYLTDISGFMWKEGQKITLAKALLSSKSDLDAGKNEDKALIDKVFRYFTKNPNLSEKQLVTMATYATMPESVRQQLDSALLEKKFELTVTSSKTVDMLGQILDEFKKDQKSMPKEEWSRIISKVQTKNGDSTVG